VRVHYAEHVSVADRPGVADNLFHPVYALLFKSGRLYQYPCNWPGYTIGRGLHDVFLISSYLGIYVSQVNGNQHVFQKYSNYRAMQNRTG
jgi:hypothetical protein